MATEATATARTAAPADATSRALGALLGAEAAAELLRTALGRDAFRTHIGAEAARRLFGWPQLNAALAEHRLQPPRLRLERAGGDYTKGLFTTRRTRRAETLYDLDSSVLNARLRDGATLILDAANELSAPLRELCADLAAEFLCACQTNMYACWGTTQGFDVHWDDHDVLVVQVEGEKQWMLYGPSRAAPTRRDGHQDEAPAEPLEEVVLQPGDVLYLPRGYWHAAVGLGGPTMHLTIGLTRKSGSDFLQWLADHLLAEASVRQDLPLEGGDDILAAHLSGLLATVAAADPAELGRAYRRHVEGRQAYRPELSFPLIGEEDEPFRPDTRIALAPGAARLESGKRDGDVVLVWRGYDFTVDSGVQAVLADLVAGSVLPFAEVEARSAAALRRHLPVFLRDLAQRGVLVVSQGS